MPKETVYAEIEPFGEDSTARAILEVRWSRNEFVEIGSRVVEAGNHASYMPTENERPTWLEENNAWPGMYLSLNRASINDLIRHLRRARDQAFGKDE